MSIVDSFESSSYSSKSAIERFKNVSFTIKFSFFFPISLTKASSPSFISSMSYLTIEVSSFEVEAAERVISVLGTSYFSGIVVLKRH